jgi:hypothetical protein
MENSDQLEISIFKKIISIFLGIAIVGFGIFLGLIPIIQIVIRLLSGEQVHGNMGIFALSVPLIPLGVCVLVSSFRNR